MTKRRMQRTAGAPLTNKYLIMKRQTLEVEEKAGYPYELTPGEKQRRLSQLLRFGIIDYEEFLKRSRE